MYLIPSVVHCCCGGGCGEGGCGHTSTAPWSPLLHSGGWSFVIVRKVGLGWSFNRSSINLVG